MSAQINEIIPAFTASATNEQTVTENNLLGKFTVLYFYPRDNTPGCTTEGQDFTSLHTDFKNKNCQIFGVSMDSLKKHDNFIEKYNFSFDLISDPEAELCKLFDVYKLKKNYGKEYMGIERSTFLINPEGILIQEWRKVKVADHAAEVLASLKTEIRAQA